MALIKEMASQGYWLFKYRGQLPLVLLVAGLWVNYYTVSEADPYCTQYWFYICLGVCLVGQLVRILAVGHTPKNTSGRNTGKQIADELNTSGIYSIVRHPLYVGNFFMWLGVAMLTHNIWLNLIFILIYWIYYERIMFAEEDFLRGKFGDDYYTWSSKTPAFIPKISLWKKSKLPFSMRNILKREYTGFFNIFLAIFIFEMERIIIQDIEFSYTNPWFIMLVVAVVQLLVLRTIKKTTKILHVEGR